jgi:TatD DNase family protein
MLKEVASQLPLDRILVETDSPYLAPIPYRGKINQPAYVKHVAEELSRIRNISLAEIMEVTTANFFRLFNTANSL